MQEAVVVAVDGDDDDDDDNNDYAFYGRLVFGNEIMSKRVPKVPSSSFLPVFHLPFQNNMSWLLALFLSKK